jgi:hypothetical protein
MVSLRASPSKVAQAKLGNPAFTAALEKIRPQIGRLGQ